MNPWYRSFFRGLAMEYWRHAVPPARTAAEVRLVLRTLRLPPGGSVLDVLCGFGRIAVPLARRGFRVTAVDISPAAVAALEREAEERRLAVRAIGGDVLALRLPGRFDGAVCLGNSFGYLGRAGDRKLLARIAAALKPGGRFLLNTAVVAEGLLPNLRPREAASAGGVAVRFRHSFDARTRTLVSELRFSKGKRRESGVMRHEVYELAELVGLVEGAGLRTIAAFAAPGGRPYRCGAPELFLLAEK